MQHANTQEIISHNNYVVSARVTAFNCRMIYEAGAFIPAAIFSRPIISSCFIASETGDNFAAGILNIE